MQQVITQSQARAVLNGRAPLIPVEYETAIKALSECITLDEAKYWDNKADALAAWAKIYRNDDAGRKAKQLKLHAYRRMGQLAEQIRPTKKVTPFQGREPGAMSLLIESGLTRRAAQAAGALRRASSDEFSAAVATGISPHVFANNHRGTGDRSVVRSQAWAWLTHKLNLFGVRSQARLKSPRDVALALKEDEIQKARDLVTELTEWLDEFERNLPKDAK
jgi:hypothetical protein